LGGDPANQPYANSPAPRHNDLEKVRLRPHRRFNSRFPLARREDTSLGCLVVLIALFSPRLALALTWIFTPWVDRAFGPIIWPILGIIFLPLTTLLYVILWNTGGRGVTGWEWIFVVLAVFGDVVAHGAGAAKRRGAF
jgi:hypothetical protein